MDVSGENHAGLAPVRMLEELAYNLRWSWRPEAVALFRALDETIWEETRHNPVALIRRLDAARIHAALQDDALRARLDAEWADLQAYLDATNTWFDGRTADVPTPLTAYFSAEYALTECLGIYSGGLGVLAADHLKSASDLGVPLVALGLLYREGYFRQTVTASGDQVESYDRLDVDALPLRAEQRPDGQPVTVAIAFPGRQVFARIWRAQVGRIPLFLLDTDHPGNSVEDRRITARLYGGDSDTRIQQEIVLGVGAFRALRALGIRPAVYHMNEGHSAFLGLEHVRQLVHEGVPFDAAMEEVARHSVFTTHTPVPAGHDRFSRERMAQYFTAFAREMDLPFAHLLQLGREPADERHAPFSMTVLALKLSDHHNGVSKLHGAVSRKMMRGLWPELDVDDVPIGHITNGVHLASWVAPALQQVLDRELGPDWRRDGGTREAWSRIRHIDPDTLWSMRNEARGRLIDRVRRTLVHQTRRRGGTPAQLELAGQVLDPDVLTIVFARRFATYKRATLLLRDHARLDRMLNHAERPMQILFAGKAHPRDEPGKDLIRQIIRLAHQPRFRRRIVFVENYDMDLARSLVHGADVWLNNPRRPHEASGTSGMKAAVNGVLNLSVLDGWWDEAWQDAQANGDRIGWAIGEGLEPHDVGGEAALDDVDAHDLFCTLEDLVAPLFYQRENGRPTAWLTMAATAIATLGPAFSAHRMVREYTERYYLPAAAATAPATTAPRDR
jgi:glycogen phosphorylase